MARNWALVLSRIEFSLQPHMLLNVEHSCLSSFLLLLFCDVKSTFLVCPKDSVEYNNSLGPRESYCGNWSGPPVMTCRLMKNPVNFKDVKLSILLQLDFSCQMYLVIITDYKFHWRNVSFIEAKCTAQKSTSQNCSFTP